VKKATGGREE